MVDANRDADDGDDDERDDDGDSDDDSDDDDNARSGIGDGDKDVEDRDKNSNGDNERKNGDGVIKDAGDGKYKNIRDGGDNGKGATTNDSERYNPQGSKLNLSEIERILAKEFLCLRHCTHNCTKLTLSLLFTDHCEQRSKRKEDPSQACTSIAVAVMKKGKHHPKKKDTRFVMPESSTKLPPKKKKKKKKKKK